MVFFSEHHMEEEDQLHLTLPESTFCCQNLQTCVCVCVCVCVFVCFCLSRPVCVSAEFYYYIIKSIWKFFSI
jgi:hypothetical protein